LYEQLPSLYPAVYENIKVEKDPDKKLVMLLTGFTCSGKDTVMEAMEETGRVFHVVTATSRQRREGEPESKYVWMRERKVDETEEEYEGNLTREYNLVEHDTHYGAVYGLPLQSLEKEGGSIPVIRPDISGVITLQEVLPEFGFQPISVALMPDSWEQLYDVLIKERGMNIQKANSRLYKDVRDVDDYLNNIHYFLHNGRFEYGEMTGLERSVKALEYILERYK
jgi:guanylate kinase